MANPGLDSAALPEDTGDTQDTSGLQAVSAKPVKGKGNLALPTPTGGVGYDPTLLEKMEAMIKRKEAEQNGFMSSLQDATAWWSGGVAGPGEALRARAEQRAKQQEELFGMQSQLSQARTAQQRADALQKELSGGVTGGGVGGGAGTGDIATLFASMPSDQQALYKMALRQGDLDGAKSILAEFSKKKLGASFAPDFQTTQEYPVIINGKLQPATMTKGEYMEYKQTGKLPAHLTGGEPSAGGRGATGASAEGVPTFKDPSIKVTSDYRDNAKQTKLYKETVDNGTPGFLPNGVPVAKPGTSPHETRPKGEVLDISPKGLTKSGRLELAQLGYYQPYGIDSPHWEKIPAATAAPTAPAVSGGAAAATSPVVSGGAQVKPMAPLPPAPKAPAPLTAPTTAPAAATTPQTPAPVAAAPSAPVVAPQAPIAAPAAVATKPTTFSMKEMADQAAQDRELQKISFQTEEKGRATELETKAKDVAGRQAATVEAYRNAPTDLANYKFIDQLVKTNPRAFGVLQHADVMSAIGTVLEGGATVPGQGNVNVKNIDDAVRKAMPGSQESDIIAAQKAARVFSQLQLNQAKVVLKGQGAVSDMERQLVANMTGSTKNSPEAIRDFLAWGRMRSQYDEKVGDAMDAWEAANPNKSFRQFELTPEYKALRNAYKMQVDEFAQKSGSYTPNTTKMAKPAGFDNWAKSNKPQGSN